MKVGDAHHISRPPWWLACFDARTQPAKSLPLPLPHHRQVSVVCLRSLNADAPLSSRPMPQGEVEYDSLAQLSQTAVRSNLKSHRLGVSRLLILPIIHSLIHSFIHQPQTPNPKHNNTRRNIPPLGKPKSVNGQSYSNATPSKRLGPGNIKPFLMGLVEVWWRFGGAWY